MNATEVTNAVLKDLAQLQATTLPRLREDYNRERKKLGIAKDKPYFKTYPVKTKTKNTWLIFLQKSPSSTYKGPDDIVHSCAVYYYDKKGLKVIRYCKELKNLEVFWGHFFQRYNERLGLGITNTLDIIKAFFHNSGYLHYLVYPDGDRQRNIGICKEGFCFGGRPSEDGWLVNKTFVSRDLAYKSQRFLEASLLKELKQDVFKMFTAPTYDAVRYHSYQNSIASITGQGGKHHISTVGPSYNRQAV